MQLYNTLSAQERAALIDEAGEERLTYPFMPMHILAIRKYCATICLFRGMH